MLFEYEAVVMRPEQRQATGMTMVEVGVFFDGLAALLLQCCPIFCGVRSTPISAERNSATIWDETAQFLPRKSDALRLQG
jgi:hypothetical protein